jgi:hypothetical protein
MVLAFNKIFQTPEDPKWTRFVIIWAICILKTSKIQVFIVYGRKVYTKQQWIIYWKKSNAYARKTFIL